MGSKAPQGVPHKISMMVQEFMAVLENKNIHNLQIRSSFASIALKENLSLHVLKMNFVNEILEMSPERFLEYVNTKMTGNLSRKAQVTSKNQSKSSEWHELRYGRITVFKMHEASRCKTLNGGLVEHFNPW